MDKKKEIDLSLLANVLAQLSYQQGYIKGVGDLLGKKLDAMDGFLGDLHCDILRQFEDEKERSDG